MIKLTLLAALLCGISHADSTSVYIGGTTFNNGAVESRDIGGTRFYSNGATDTYIGGYILHHEAPTREVPAPYAPTNDALRDALIQELLND